MRGVAEANPEIPRFARNKLRNPMKNEIAAPFGLAMTLCGVKIFNAFVLVRGPEDLPLAPNSEIITPNVIYFLTPAPSPFPRSMKGTAFPETWGRIPFHFSTLLY